MALFLRCKWKRCRLLFTIWKNSFFEHAHLDNILLLEIINLWFTGASYGLMAHILGCSKQNIVNTINKLQIFNIYERYLKDVKQVGGNNIVVEIDESKIGKNKYNRGKPVKGFWCFGMVEHTTDKKIIFVHIKKGDEQTLFLYYLNTLILNPQYTQICGKLILTWDCILKDTT